MAMRVSGINSGLDTDAIVQELVSAYSKKTESVTKQQTKHSWKQEIWKGLNAKVYSLYSSISNFRYDGTYNLKKTTSSDTTKATVSASGNAIVGSQKLNILKTAQSAYLTGDKITTKDGKEVKSDTKLGDIGITRSSTLQVRTTDDEGNFVTKDVTLKQDMTIAEAVKQFQSAGVNASFDEGTGRLFISAKTSGRAGDFSILAASTKKIPLIEDGEVKKDENGNVIYVDAECKPSEVADAKSALSFLGLSTDISLVASNVKFASTSVTLSQNATLANLGYVYRAQDHGGVEEPEKGIDVRGADGERIGTLKIKSTTRMSEIASQLRDMGVNAKFDIQTDAEGNRTGRFIFQGAENLSFSSLDEDGDAIIDKLGFGTSNALKVGGGVQTLASSANKMSELGWDGTQVTLKMKVDGLDDPVEVTINKDDEVQSVAIKMGNALRAAGVDDSIANGIFYNETTGKLEFGDAKIAFSSDDKFGGDALLKLGLESGKSDNVNRIYMPDSYVSSDASLSSLGIEEGALIKFKDRNGQEVSFTIAADETISSFIQKFGSVGDIYGSYYDKGRLNIDVEGLGGDEAGKAALKKLGLIDDFAKEKTSQAVKIYGEDAEIRLNGVKYTSSNGNFSINGLSITAQGVTGDGDENAININVANDTQGLYDKVKDFLTQYNSVINEITKLYNADSAKGYEPLTDDEKSAMNDVEIEKWETKIKDSLLRRDNTLDSLMSAMISSMNKGILINGKNYSLASFGIQTLGFLNAPENEFNALHIDGDADDENTSGNKEKLMKAINEDPDTVVAFMKQLATNLYTAIDKQMQGTSLRSRFKIYNDKEMDTQYNNYAKQIKNWEDKVSAKEDYYYKKFSKMESALSKLNSQTNYLSGLFGSR